MSRPTRLQLRYDTLSNWTSGDPLPKLAKGEVGIANDGIKIIAKVGTDDTPQTWEQASFLSVQEDSSVGVNIENVGRVILEMYIGDDITNDLVFTDCISKIKFKDDSNTSAISNCSAYNPNQSIGISNFHINATNDSQNLVGWRTSSEQRPYGLIHPRLVGTFDCNLLEFNVSNIFPLRPISFDGSVLMYCRGIEVWELPLEDDEQINFIEKIDAWIPVPTYMFGSSTCSGSGGGGETDDVDGGGETDDVDGGGETDDVDGGTDNPPPPPPPPPCPDGQKYVSDCPFFPGPVCSECAPNCPPCEPDPEPPCSLSEFEPFSDVCIGTNKNDCLSNSNPTTSGGGCSDCDCCAAVCAEDSFCCESQWDAACAQIALQPELASVCAKDPGGEPPETFCENSEDPSENIEHIIGCWNTRNNKYLESPCAVKEENDDLYIWAESLEGNPLVFTNQDDTSFLNDNPCDRYNASSIAQIPVHNNDRILNSSLRPYPQTGTVGSNGISVTSGFWDNRTDPKHSPYMGIYNVWKLIDIQVLAEISNPNDERVYKQLTVCLNGVTSSSPAYVFVYVRRWSGPGTNNECDGIWTGLRPPNSQGIPWAESWEIERNFNFSLPGDYAGGVFIEGGCGAGFYEGNYVGFAQKYILNSTGGEQFNTGSPPNRQYVLLRILFTAMYSFVDTITATIDKIEVRAGGPETSCFGGPIPLFDATRIPGIVNVFPTENNNVIYTLDFSSRKKPIEIIGFPKNKQVPVYDSSLKAWIGQYAAVFNTIEEGVVYWDLGRRNWKFARHLDAGIYNKEPAQRPIVDDTDENTDL